MKLELERKIISFLKKEMSGGKSWLHDLGHLKRVAEKSKHIHQHEGGNLDVIIIASYFHKIISLPKDSLSCRYASVFAAQKTMKILRENFKEVPVNLYGAISSVIRSHNYSARIKPITIEAKIVQDADRLDALGAIGLARLFYAAGKSGQDIYHEEDPFAVERPVNDKKYALDNFYNNLLKLPEMINTQQGKIMAEKRIAYLSEYIEKLREELTL